ncbi:hypothetical protein TNCV_3614041 [Trichonephila clavipes]|uniref:Uncharacterized protein n=1 Tax=Trichonephila clavipes TaxID=2585209 RepID=A0A8X6SMB5_TRICX|nr:hypothetical protein TNCV_3614041 [Trichonephila clavipes]
MNVSNITTLQSESQFPIFSTTLSPGNILNTSASSLSLSTDLFPTTSNKKELPLLESTTTPSNSKHSNVSQKIEESAQKDGNQKSKSKWNPTRPRKPCFLMTRREGVNISVALFSYMRAFSDRPRNFKPWSSDVDDT